MSEEKNIAEVETEEEIDVTPFLNYLQSNKGHELASRILGMFEDIKKATIENSTNHAKFEKWLQALIILTVIVSASVLTYFGKFDSTLAILFGTMVGYLFGKK